MQKYMISLLFLVCSIWASMAFQEWKVNPLTSKIQDSFGRTRIIHGVNTVYKQFPYLPRRSQFNHNDSLVAEDFYNLQRWGFNSIRLYIAWQGFQPQKDQYNYTYLEQLRKIIRQAQQYNISVLVDAHQDIYSKEFCGEGFPIWTTKVENFPQPFKVELEYDNQGLPTKESCKKMSFFKYYGAEDVMKFSYEFFTNKNGIMDEFIQMWQRVVQFFVPESNIIGYDILNEPQGTSVYRSAYDYFGPGMNNNKYLLPFYRKISKAIRNIDRKTLLFFEPTPADYLGGFYDSPSQDKFINLDILSYHTYCPFKKDVGSNKCQLVDHAYIEKSQKNIKQLKIGGMITQFGSVYDDENSVKQLEFIVNKASQQLTGWYYWQFKENNDSTCSTNPAWLHSFYHSNGTLQKNKVKTLAHPYAYAICGEVQDQFYRNGQYKISFIPKKCQGKNTEIYINQEMYFPQGFEINFIPKCDQCELKAVGNIPGYYEIIITQDKIFKPIALRVVGYI